MTQPNTIDCYCSSGGVQEVWKRGPLPAVEKFRELVKTYRISSRSPLHIPDAPTELEVYDALLAALDAMVECL